MKRLSKQLRQNLAIIFISPFLVTSLVACVTVSQKNDPDKSVPDQYEKVTKDDGLASSSMNGDLLFNLLAGEFAGVRGQMKQSIEYYSDAAELSEDPQVIARAAYIALYAGENSQAIALTDRWLELNQPQNTQIDRIRALAYLHLEQLEPAVEAFEKLLMVEDRVAEQSVASMTHILSKEATPQFALEVVGRLNQKHPGEAFILLLLAKFESNLGKYESSLQHINQLLEIDKDLADAT